MGRDSFCTNNALIIQIPTGNCSVPLYINKCCRHLGFNPEAGERYENAAVNSYLMHFWWWMVIENTSGKMKKGFNCREKNTRKLCVFTFPVYPPSVLKIREKSGECLHCFFLLRIVENKRKLCTPYLCSNNKLVIFIFIIFLYCTASLEFVTPA